MTSKRSHKHKHHATFDAETARDLALIDALAEGDALVPAADEDLRLIVTELRAAAPRPREEFAAGLDRAVTSGFGEPRAQTDRAATAAGGGRSRRLGGRRQWLALAGASCVLLVALATVVSVNDEGRVVGDDPQGEWLSRPDSDVAGDSSTGASSPADSEALSEQAPKMAVPPAPLEQADEARTLKARKQVRTAELELVAKRDELEQRADEVIAVTDRYMGYVQESSVTGGDAGQANASFQLRLPADRFNDALRDLSKVAHVRARTQNVSDVTARYDSLRTALADARAQRAGLLKALANAQTEQKIQSVKLRLRGVNRRIERLADRRQQLNERIDYVALAVTISASAGDPDGSWSVGDAVDDAWRILTAIAGGLILIAAVVMPIALLVLAGFLIWRLIVSRSRERVIGGPGGDRPEA